MTSRSSRRPKMVPSTTPSEEEIQQTKLSSRLIAGMIRAAALHYQSTVLKAQAETVVAEVEDTLERLQADALEREYVRLTLLLADTVEEEGVDSAELLLDDLRPLAWATGKNRRRIIRFTEDLLEGDAVGLYLEGNLSASPVMIAHRTGDVDLLGPARRWTQRIA